MQVDQLRAIGGQRQNFGIAAHRDNAMFADGDGLGPGSGGVDRVDFAVVQNEVGCYGYHRHCIPSRINHEAVLWVAAPWRWRHGRGMVVSVSDRRVFGRSDLTPSGLRAMLSGDDSDVPSRGRTAGRRGVAVSISACQAEGRGFKSRRLRTCTTDVSRLSTCEKWVNRVFGWLIYVMPQNQMTVGL